MVNFERSFEERRKTSSSMSHCSARSSLYLEDNTLSPSLTNPTREMIESTSYSVKSEPKRELSLAKEKSKLGFKGLTSSNFE